MAENKYRYFLNYNQDNIFKNLIQAEDHLKKVKDPGFAQCVLKHLSFVEGESEEAVAHAMHIEPQKVGKYKELSAKVFELRKKLQKGKMQPNIAVMESRKIRKFFESFHPEFDISKCQACSSELKVTNYDNKKFLNKRNQLDDRTSSYILYARQQKNVEGGEIPMDKKLMKNLFAGNLLGKGIRIGASYADSRFPAVEIYKKPSTWIKIGAAIGLPLYALGKKGKAKFKLLAAIAGTNVLTEEIVDMGASFIPGIGGLGVRALAPVRVTPRARSILSGPAPANGLAQVD